MSHQHQLRRRRRGVRCRTACAHQHFRVGLIESIVGTGGDARLTIKFDTLPAPKVLVAKYAKLRVAK